MLGDEVTVFCDTGRTLTADDMKVKVNRHGCVAAIGKALTTYDAGYIGLTYVPGVNMDIYRSAVTRTLTRDGRHTHVEHVIQSMVDDGFAVHVCDLGDPPWVEIDTPSDCENLRHATWLVAKDADRL